MYVLHTPHTGTQSSYANFNVLAVEARHLEVQESRVLLSEIGALKKEIR